MKLPASAQRGDNSGSDRPKGRFRRCGIAAGIISDRRFQNKSVPAPVFEAFEQKTVLSNYDRKPKNDDQAIKTEPS